jgi:hypothetical protein
VLGALGAEDQDFVVGVSEIRLPAALVGLLLTAAPLAR